MQLHNKLLTHTSTLVFVSVAVPQLYTKTRCPVCAGEQGGEALCSAKPR